MVRVAPELQRGQYKAGHYRKLSPEDGVFSWWDVPRAIWSFLDADKARFAFFNALLFAVFFYEFVPPFVIGKVVDFWSGYRAGNSLQPFYLLIAFLTVSYAIIALIRLKTKNVLSKIAIAVRSRAKVKGFERLMDASIEWHAKENTGNKVQRVLGGSTALFEFIQLTNRNVYLILTNLVGVPLFFFFTHWTLFAFALVYVAVFLTILITFSRKMEALSFGYDQALERSSGTYIEGAGNILSIKAAGAESHVHSRVQAHEMSVKEFQFKIADTNNKKWQFFQVWNGCAYGILLFLIGQQVLAGTVSIGSILVLYVYFSKLRESANDINDIGTVLVGFKVDVGRMMPIFREKSAVRSGEKPFPKEWDALTLTDAEFHYPNTHVGLSRFNLHISRGARVGIAGGSGSGKSTLVKILLGLYELKRGKFAVGEADFYGMSREAVTGNIAVVLQETELFNLSFQENITMMRDFDRELFARAIKVADLKEVIERLPEGVDTYIGERGYNLSGGERQRIGIARAIYKDCPIVILDEATSSLDSKTEKHIVARLFGEFGGDKTFLIVAHRLSTIRNADEVIVFDKGAIVERGKFDTLIKRKGSKLGSLYALQH